MKLDDSRPTPTSRILFLLVVVLLLVPAIHHTYSKAAFFIDQTRRREGNVWANGQVIGADFIQFAAVAESWERGRIDELYASAARQKEFMTLAAELDRPYDGVLQFNYPPFVAWLLRPLAPLGYLQRYVGWMLLQTSFAVVALALWRRELGTRLFFVAAVGWMASPPVLSNFVLGQTAFMGLAFLTGALYLANREKDFSAGLVLSLLFYKPTLGVVVGPLFVAAGRWRLVFGVAVGATLLTAASLAVSWQACRDFPKLSRELVIQALESPGFYTRHFNLLGLVSTFLGKTPEEFNWARRAVVVVPIAVLFIMTAKAWCVPWRPGTPRWSAGASAALLTTFVATPYLFTYDTMLAAVAAVYSLTTWNVRPIWHRWYILACLSLAWYCLAIHNHFAPIAIAAWAVLEANWASSQVQVEPTAVKSE